MKRKKAVYLVCYADGYGEVDVKRGFSTYEDALEYRAYVLEHGLVEGRFNRLIKYQEKELVIIEIAVDGNWQHELENTGNAL